MLKWLVATAQAPAGGTLVGYPVPVPPGLTPNQIALGDYRPQPFSLASSVMIDDLSKLGVSIEQSGLCTFKQGGPWARSNN